MHPVYHFDFIQFILLKMQKGLRKARNLSCGGQGFKEFNISIIKRLHDIHTELRCQLKLQGFGMGLHRPFARGRFDEEMKVSQARGRGHFVSARLGCEYCSRRARRSSFVCRARF